MIQYLEPTQALVTVLAATEEEAVNLIKKNLAEVDDLEIIELREVEQSLAVLDGEVTDSDYPVANHTTH